MLREEAVSGGIQPDRSLPSVRPTRIITYAWGEKYIGELLSLTLPALLAPGNLPYVASTVPCEVVILTEEGAFPRLFGDPTVGKIQALCPVRLVGLDDFIPAPDKYGMALTYVLHRGFSDLGLSVTDTWLLFLNADFIIADGSLRNLIGQLAEGRRLVASPSYCVNAEAVVPELLSRVDPNTRSLTLSPREMAALVLRHRHNTIRGKTVNQPAMSVRYMDQFYWLVDHATLIGHQMPIAIVGMRPERHLAEPNSYWDHGLMTEFFPGTEPFVLGDSDDFLMLELRSADVAQDQLQMGWPEPRDIARHTLSYLTAYQKDMARHALTLHATDLPAGVDEARTKLRAFVDSVLAHVPAVLPSHIDHPQWDYHRPGFFEARHKYLSARLGSTTETAEPPASFGELDRIWWKLDGLAKSHARRRGELINLKDRQCSAVNAVLRRIADTRWSNIGEQLERDLDSIEPGSYEKPVDLHGMISYRRQQDAHGAMSLSRGEGSWVEPILRSAQAWIPIEDELRTKRGLLVRALEFIEKDHRERLAQADFEYETARRDLQSDYDRLMKRHVISAAIPQVLLHAGPRTAVAPSHGYGLLQLARQAYYGCYGRLPRVQVLHPCWAAMRHLVRLVDTAASNGAANVLVVVGTSTLGDTVADDLPGLHAQVSLKDVLQGDLTKAFGDNPEFELCICTLASHELARFTEIVNAVAPCMRRGGKIVGFHPNFGLNPIPMYSIKMPQGSPDAPSGRIYFAGSEKSAHVVQRFHRLYAGTSKSRFSNIMRTMMMLTMSAPSAFIANRTEAAIPESQWSQLPAQCTSVTIEVTVQ